MSSTELPSNDTEVVTNCFEYNLFTTITRGLLGSLILLGNVLTITALSRAKKGIAQKGKLYVLSLSWADLLMAPMVLGDLLMVKMKVYSCLSAPNIDAITEEIVWKKRIANSVMVILTFVSYGCNLASLLFIAIDRLLAVSKPVFYKHHVTKFKIRCLLATFWLYWVGLTLILVCYFSRTTPPERIFFALGNTLVIPDFYFKYVGLAHIYFYIMANIIFFSISFVFIRRMDAKMTSQTRSDSFKRTKIFMRMSGMTLLTFFILYMPYLIIANVVDRTDRNPLVRNYVLRLSYTILYSNSWVNPIIYCLSNKEYREAYKRLLHIKAKKVQSLENASSSGPTQQSQLN